MIDNKYYEEFDYFDDITYLDVASVGLQPKRTLEHCRSFQDEFVKSYGRICFGPYKAYRNQTAGLAAKLINGTEKEILFTSNTTEGDNLLVNCLEMKPGDSVISSSFEYPAVVLGWAQKQAEGIKLKLVPSENGIINAEDVIAMMDDTTRVVALSFVQYMSGFKADLKKIGRECRKRNIIFMVDGIQGIGRNPIDVEDMCIDLLSCGGFKGLLGVFGTGFVYCRKELMPRLNPTVFNENNIDFNEEVLHRMTNIPVFPYKQGVARFEGGSRSTYGITSLGKSIGLLLEVGIPEIHDKVIMLEKEFRNLVSEKNIPVKFLGSDDAGYWSGNICITYDEAYTDIMRETLIKNNIYANVKNGFLRISFHYYNTRENVIKAVEAIESIFRSQP